jgi:hypothetical protein
LHLQALDATLASESIAPPFGRTPGDSHMINVNDITEKISVPKFDLPKFDLPKFDMPKLDLTNFDLAKVKLPKFDTPKVDLPKFDLPKFDLPKFDLPKFDLPKIDVSRATDFARDAAYVGVGAVVISVQTVTEQITGQFRKVVGSAD